MLRDSFVFICYSDFSGQLRGKGLPLRELEARFGSALERARSLTDLVVTSVLLDAGAGPDWRYVEAGTNLARVARG